MTIFDDDSNKVEIIPFTKEQLKWILTHVKLTRKGKKLARQIRRWIKWTK